MKELDITEETLKQRDVLRKLLKNENRRFQEATKLKCNRTFSEEQKKEVSERMKKYWLDRKTKQNKTNIHK